jgi:hypothetical protein
MIAVSQGSAFGDFACVSRRPPMIAGRRSSSSAGAIACTSSSRDRVSFTALLRAETPARLTSPWRATTSCAATDTSSRSGENVVVVTVAVTGGFTSVTRVRLAAASGSTVRTRRSTWPVAVVSKTNSSGSPGLRRVVMPVNQRSSSARACSSSMSCGSEARGRSTFQVSRAARSSEVSNGWGSSPGPGTVCAREPPGITTRASFSSVYARYTLAATPGRAR